MSIIGEHVLWLDAPLRVVVSRIHDWIWEVFRDGLRGCGGCGGGSNGPSSKRAMWLATVMTRSGIAGRDTRGARVPYRFAILCRNWEADGGGERIGRIGRIEGELTGGLVMLTRGEVEDRLASTGRVTWGGVGESSSWRVEWNRHVGRRAREYSSFFECLFPFPVLTRVE